MEIVKRVANPIMVPGLTTLDLQLLDNTSQTLSLTSLEKLKDMQKIHRIIDTYQDV
jgi:hypothetical protein